MKIKSYTNPKKPNKLQRNNTILNIFVSLNSSILKAMKHYLSLTFILILITSCTKDNNQITNLTVNLTHTVDNTNLVMGGALLPYTNPAGEQYNIRRLQYIISNIKLNKVNEESILLKSIHFADLEDLTTLSIDMGELDNAEYTSITFTMGLENSNNITNTHLNENWHPTMAWPDIMGGGYHYMKLEGDFDTGNMRYKARERYSFGYSNFRAVYGSQGA